MEGKIKWYKREKGYGFITGEDGKDYFMHYTALPEDQQDVREDDEFKVSFETKEGRDGRLQAGEIKFEGSSSDEAAPSEASTDEE